MMTIILETIRVRNFSCLYSCVCLLVFITKSCFFRVPIPGSPFAVNVRRGCDPNKVKAFGPGLERGVVKVC